MFIGGDIMTSKKTAHCRGLLIGLHITTWMRGQAAAATPKFVHCLAVTCPVKVPLPPRIICMRHNLHVCHTVTNAVMMNVSYLDAVAQDNKPGSCKIWSSKQNKKIVRTCVRGIDKVAVDCKQWYGGGIKDNALATYTELLQHVHALSQTLSFDYSIAYGTALGWYRFKTVSPWDDEIDIMIPRTKTKLVQSEIKHPYCYAPINDKHWKIYKCNSPKAGQYHWGYPFLDTWPTDDQFVFPSKPGMLFGTPTRVPNDPKNFLRHKYGPNFETQCKAQNYNHAIEKRNNDIPSAASCNTLVLECFPTLLKNEH